MSHFTVWLALTVGAILGADLGLSSLETAVDCTRFSGLALLVHWGWVTR